jgi:acetyl-CoA carboxylase biotin carboxyl carrier protein
VSRPTKPDDVEILIQDFDRSGMRELHLRCDQFELYLSSDPNGRGIETAYESRTDALTLTSTALSPDAAAQRANIDAAKPANAASATVTAPLAQQLPPNATVVRAPYLGTFYRSPKPGAVPYVEPGDTVVVDTELCLVEVMKLFTAVRAGVAGRVFSVLAADGQLVEGDQALFVVVPGQ